MLRGTSASDEPVSVDTGLVLLDVNELKALVFRMCLAVVPLPFGGRLPFTSCNGDLFCRKISSRVCSSSFDFFVLSANECGGLPPISSSVNSNKKIKLIFISQYGIRVRIPRKSQANMRSTRSQTENYGNQNEVERQSNTMNIKHAEIKKGFASVQIALRENLRQINARDKRKTSKHKQTE